IVGATATVLDGGATSVIANDTDIENDTLTVTGFTQPTHGTVTGNSDGTFRYTHTGSTPGSDSFTYTISDGSETATATVNITIVPPNQPPLAVDDAATVNEGGTVTTLTGGATSVLDNDTDEEGDTLTVITNSTPAH